jgi:hypothetical protein
MAAEDAELGTVIVKVDPEGIGITGECSVLAGALL